MLSLLTDVIVNFGVGSLIGNVGTTVITKSGNKIVDKVAIGLGVALVGAMAKDATKKFVDEKIVEVKDMFAKKPESVKEEEVNEDGGEISE